MSPLRIVPSGWTVQCPSATWAWLFGVLPDHLIAYGSGHEVPVILLTSLWLTTPGSATGNSDLDPPHGNSASWKVVEIVPTPAQSKIPAVRELPTKGRPGTPELLTQVKPAIDAAVVTTTPVAGQTAAPQPFATLGISSSTDYILTFPGSKSYQYIDKTKNFFWHYPRYAAVQFCPLFE